MKRFFAVIVLSAAALAWARSGLGAPGPKGPPKDAPPGPITDDQLKATVLNLKQIGLAWHNYEAAHAHFPSNQLDNKAKPLLSWRVQILPYIEQDALYRQFKMDEPWDSANNKALIEKMPKMYAPVRGKAEPGMTDYQAFTGKNALLKPGQRAAIASVTDGTSNTLMVAEAAKPVPWTKPDDLVFDGKDVPALGGMFDGKFHAVYCDLSVRRFKKEVNPDVLKLLIDPSDGTVIPADVGIDDDDKK